MLYLTLLSWLVAFYSKGLVIGLTKGIPNVVTCVLFCICSRYESYKCANSSLPFLSALTALALPGSALIVMHSRTPCSSKYNSCVALNQSNFDHWMVSSFKQDCCCFVLSSFLFCTHVKCIRYDTNFHSSRIIDKICVRLGP